MQCHCLNVDCDLEEQQLDIFDLLLKDLEMSGCGSAPRSEAAD